MSNRHDNSQSLIVRPYHPDDFTMLESWWREHDVVAPTRDMLPLESTFVLEINGVPALSVALYLTNTPAVAYVENYIANPATTREARRKAAEHLLQYIEQFAHSRGYRRLFCLAHKSGLKARYQELGFTCTGDNVAAFVKLL